MSFKPTKKAHVEMKDVRLSIPVEVWEAVERMAARDGLESAEVARQALAYSMRQEMKAMKKETKA